jgi:hypothetical protein
MKTKDRSNFPHVIWLIVSFIILFAAIIFSAIWIDRLFNA